MEERHTNLTFKQWVLHVFDHEVKRPEWYFDIDADFWDRSPAVTVDYLTQLFNGMPSVVEEYSDAQINQGLWYIANPMFCNYMLALTDSSVNMSKKIGCVQAMFPLFRNLFASRCSPHLGHLSEGGNPLNRVCYMWWDLLPIGPSPQGTSRVAFDKTILDVMQKTLLLNSPACQEAALHGLGHWASVTGHRGIPVRSKTLSSTS